MDPKEENDSKNVSWCKDEKVVNVDLDLKYSGQGNRNDEFYESALMERVKIGKEDLDQKQFDLSLKASFNITCQKVQVEFNDRKCDNDITKTDTIKKETIDENEIPVKELSYYQDCSIKSEIIELEELHIKDEEDDENSLNEKIGKSGTQLLTLHQCPKCPYSTNKNSCLKTDLNIHKKPDEINWYHCQECPYKTFQKTSLKIHGKIHIKKKQRVQKTNQWLQCPECSFKTSLPSRLRKHVLAHKSDSFKCTECSYQTRTKYQLTVHQVKHQSKDKWHSCPLCPYQSHNKSVVTTHSRQCHGIDPNNPNRIIKTFKCTKCPYEGVRKNDFKTHQLSHDASSWFQCPDCTYRTPYKRNLKEHQVRHQEQNKKCWHRCLECSYKSLYKANLKKHLISHTSTDEWLECSQCSFKTARKYSLKQHQLMHKAAHEVEWFCCYKCAFKTKHKSNLSKHISKHKRN